MVLGLVVCCGVLVRFVLWLFVIVILLRLVCFGCGICCLIVGAGFVNSVGALMF